MRVPVFVRIDRGSSTVGAFVMVVLLGSEAQICINPSLDVRRWIGLPYSGDRGRLPSGWLITVPTRSRNSSLTPKRDHQQYVYVRKRRVSAWEPFELLSGLNHKNSFGEHESTRFVSWKCLYKIEYLPIPHFHNLLMRRNQIQKVIAIANVIKHAIEGTQPFGSSSWYLSHFCWSRVLLNVQPPSHSQFDIESVNKNFFDNNRYIKYNWK